VKSFQKRKGKKEGFLRRKLIETAVFSHSFSLVPSVYTLVYTPETDKKLPFLNEKTQLKAVFGRKRQNGGKASPDFGSLRMDVTKRNDPARLSRMFIWLIIIKIE